MLILYYRQGLGRLTVARYGSGGRLLGEEVFEGVRQLVFRGVTVRSHSGVEGEVRVYVVEGSPRVEKRGAVIIVSS
ncbi:MAG: hypothetical protein GXO15_06275 [Crenarchaeota archaeon]|nr:hypothetical protein [Thermoproteota archaeon]